MNIPDHIALAAAIALGQPTEPEPQDTAPTVDLRADLHPKQQEVWDAVEEARADMSSARIVVLWGRRTGKSQCVIRLACKAAKETPEGVVPYISITRKHAKLNFWKLFKRVAVMLDPDAKANESDLTIDFPGGGIVWLGGADKIDELDKYRASMSPLAVIDEMQRFPSTNVEYLVREVIEPALFDCGAPLILAGTPGKVMRGGLFWYDASGPDAPNVFRANMLDNPFLPDVPARLAKLREDRGWTENTPEYVREYLGRWADDPEGLVFPLDPDRNSIAALPTTTPGGAPLDESKWRFVMGVDDGYSPDPLAIVILAAHPDLRDDFTVFAKKYPELLSDQTAKIVRDLMARWDIPVIVWDTGGAGKRHAEELRRRYGLPIVAAEKQDKESAVRVCRDRVLSGAHKVLDGPETDELRQELAVIGWDEKAAEKGHRLPEDGAIDHAMHGWLYAQRQLFHYREQDRFARPKPRRGSVEELEELERMDEEREIKRARAKGRRRAPAWDA